jgi:hypothetical protein
MTRFLTLAVILAMTASAAVAAPRCKDPKGKFIKCPAPAAAPAAPTPAAEPARHEMVSTGGHPVCKKGKPCGHSCISMDKVCHK